MKHKFVEPKGRLCEIVQPACVCRRHISSPRRGSASLGVHATNGSKPATAGDRGNRTMTLSLSKRISGIGLPANSVACIRRLAELCIPSLNVKNDMGFSTSILNQHFEYHEITQPACGCRRHIGSPGRGFASLGLTPKPKIRACGSRRQRTAWTQDIKIHGAWNPMLKCQSISQLTKPARSGTGRKINVIHESPLPYCVRDKRTGSSNHKDTSNRHA